MATNYYVDAGGVTRRNLEPRTAASSRVITTDPAGTSRIGNLPALQGSRAVVPQGQPVTHSQSRALVPAGKTGLPATVPRPSISAPPGGQANFYSYRDGATTRMDPRTQSVSISDGTQGRAGLPPPQGKLPPPAPRPQHEPNYRARAESMHRAKRDSAAWQAERASRPGPVPNAPGGQPPPSGGGGVQRVASGVRGRLPNGRLPGLVAALPAAISQFDDDAMERYATRFAMDAPTGDGSYGDLGRTALLRGLGFASDLGSTLSLGLVDGLYRDKQGVHPEQVAENAGLVGGGVAGSKGGSRIGRGVDFALRAITRGRYRGNAAERFLRPAGAVGGAVGGQRLAQELSADADPEIPADAELVLEQGGAAPGGQSTAGAGTAPAPSREGLTVTDTSVPGIARIEGLEGAPNMFTDNVDRAITQAQSSAANRNATAAEQALDGRLNRGTTSLPSIAAGAEPDYMVRGLDGRLVSAQESGYQPGGIVVGDSTGLDPRRPGFNPRAFRAAMQRQEATQRAAEQQQDFALRREELAEDRAARIARFDPNESRLTAAQATQAEMGATQAAQVQQLTTQLLMETDPERRTQLQQALMAMQGKTQNAGALKDNFIRRKVPVLNEKGFPVGEQEEVVDLRTGQALGSGPSLPPAAGEVRGGYRFKGGNPADEKSWEKV